MKTKRRAALIGLILLTVAGALTGCLGTKSTAEEPTSSSDTTPTEETPASLLVELREWEITFLAKHVGQKQPHLYIARADGTRLRQLDNLRGDKQTPNWSPDGRRVAIRWVPDDYARTTPLLILKSGGARQADLTKRTGLAGWSPSWSPDGRRLVTAAMREGDSATALYVMTAEGSDVRRITPADREAQYATWSPDGERIAFTFVESGGFDIFTIRPDGSDLRRLTDDGSGGQNNWPMWSPDGTKIAWGKGEAVWVMNSDGTGQRVVSEAGGVPGAWAPGPFITFQCNVPEGIGICAIREDGTALTALLGGRQAGFPGWRPPE